MKTILIFLVLTASAFAQRLLTGTEHVNPGPVVYAQAPELTVPPSPKFMVHWQTIEPAYGSNFSYAMICSPEHPDCNVPSVDVDHYDTFHSESDALKFVNNDFRTSSVSTTTYSMGGLTTEGTIFTAQKSNIRGKKFVALYAIKAIPTKVTEYEIEIPQPAKTEQRTKVEKQ